MTKLPKLAKLTLGALVVLAPTLAPTLASAQDQTVRMPHMFTAVPSVQTAPLTLIQRPPARQAFDTSYLNGAQSICPPGSSLQWQIIPSTGEPNGATGYVLGCE